MSEHADVAQSVWGIIGSVAIKTAAAGSSVGAVEVAANAVPVLSPMDVPILFGFSGSNICQIVGTAYIIGLVIVALRKKYKAWKKVNDDLYKSTIMGGSGGDGP
jgi:hypothetical protein